MSDMPTPPDAGDTSDGGDLTAAEYALGVLSRKARAAAEVRSENDPAFGQEIVAWIVRFAPLIENVAPVEPSAALWPRIEAAADRLKPPVSPPVLAPTPSAANDDAPRAWNFWRVWAVAASAVAAAAILFVAIRPALFSGGSAPGSTVLAGGGDGRTLLATLALTESKASAFTVAYDPVQSRLYATPAGDFSIPRARAAELWLIPADGKPRALGLVDPSKPAQMPMPPQFKGLAREKAVLALSIEPAGGSTTGSPTGPVVATGQLAAV